MHMSAWLVYIPRHVPPLLASVYPARQEQVKEPGVLEQDWSQLLLPTEHSSISAKWNVQLHLVTENIHLNYKARIPNRLWAMHNLQD